MAAKMLNALLLIAAMDLSLMLFLGAYTPTMSLITLMLNPVGWTELAFISQLVLAIALVGSVGIIVGSFTGVKSDFIVFAGVTAVFLSYGASIWQVYQRIISVPQFDKSNYLAVLLIAPLIIMYVYIVIKFWRGTD